MNESAIQAVLVRCPKGTVKSLRPGHVLKLGRHPKNDLPVQDKRYNSVSRYHAEIVWEKGEDGPKVLDKGSSNGTFVDGEHVKASRPLRDGSKIVLGRAEPVRVEFKIDESKQSFESGPSRGAPVLPEHTAKTVDITPEHTRDTDRWPNLNEIGAYDFSKGIRLRPSEKFKVVPEEEEDDEDTETLDYT